MTSDIGITITVKGTFEDVLDRVTAALKAQGFGVLTEIDVKATLKAKLDLDFGRQYKILGACNPPFAHQMLSHDLMIGLLLPCNVIVYEGDTEGEIVVSAVNPLAMMQLPVLQGLDDALQQVEAKLRAALDALG